MHRPGLCSAGVRCCNGRSSANSPTSGACARGSPYGRTSSSNGARSSSRRRASRTSSSSGASNSTGTRNGANWACSASSAYGSDCADDARWSCANDDDAWSMARSSNWASSPLSFASFWCARMRPCDDDVDAGSSDGNWALACCLKRIPYQGFCLTEKHLESVTERVITELMLKMLSSKEPVYEPKLAARY